MEPLNDTSNQKKHPREDGQSEPRSKKHKKRHVSPDQIPFDAFSNTFQGEENGSAKSQKSRDPMKKSSSQKVANLLKALDEALDEDSLEETSNTIGNETLKQCLDLRTSLRTQTPSSSDAEPVPPSSKPASETKPSDGPNIPKSMTPVSITPWHSSDLPNNHPPLPAVLDKTLEEASFTHTNTGAGRITDITYERLEWVGDAYLELVATLLISQTFPHLTPGKMSQFRELCIKNLTLAEFSRAYGFDKRAKLGNLVVRDQASMTKIHGDMFEAYVAAIILSDPENGLDRAAQWLKVLWGQKLKKEIVQEELRGKEIKISNPMWKLVGDARDAIKQKAPLNPKDQLQKALGSKGVKIEYRDIGTETKDRTNKLPLFTVGVYLHGWGENGKQLGRGSANGKKDAGMKAAEEALRDKKMMAGYIEKKRVFDEQMELERQALQQAKSS
jgi:ribonuclease-3